MNCIIRLDQMMRSNILNDNVEASRVDDVVDGKENVSSHVNTLLKNLIFLLLIQDLEDNSFQRHDLPITDAHRCSR
jgi:hypothetical protein